LRNGWEIGKQKAIHIVVSDVLKKEEVGGGLLSHTVSSAVPSALVGLTTGFGMGPGVPPQL
jgi:hypothetical protein